MKKTLIVLASLLITPQAFANFSDVPTDHPYLEAINWAQENNIVQGFADGTFKPNQKINRAELVKIIIEANFDDLEIKGENCFPDVKDEWFAKYVCTAKREGIVKGYEDGIFRPWQNISFVESIKVITNANKMELINEESLTEWYEPYVFTFLKKDLIPNTIFQYDHIMTRAESTEIIYRIIDDRYEKFSLEYTENNYKERFKDKHAHGHFRKDDKVFYDKKEINNADFNTFKYVNSFYGKDKNNVYYKDKLLENADSKTFGATSLYGKDDYNVFYADKLLNKADTFTFEHLEGNVYSRCSYFKDKNKIYIYGNILEKAHSETFQIFHKEYAKDANNVYYRCDKQIQGADSNTFEVLEPYTFSKDKNNVYRNGEIIKEADPNSFKIINDINNDRYLYSKDWHSVYFDNEKIKEANPETFMFLDDFYTTDKNNVYGNGVRAKTVDINTFEILDRFYTKDKNNVYYHFDIKIQGADPKTFEILDHNYSKDKEHVYLYGTKLLIDDVKIDTASFKVFKDEFGQYAKDNYNIYYCYDQKVNICRVLAVNNESFELVKNDYSKDKQNCYNHQLIVPMSECTAIENSNQHAE